MKDREISYEDAKRSSLNLDRRRFVAGRFELGNHCSGIHKS